MATNQPELKKVLKPVHLWAMAVGLVISGEYFGWNYGWGVAGTLGFLVATLVVTLFYVTFVFSFTELTTSIPHAGGPFAYAYRAMGPVGALVAGYATLVEFVFAAPAIAFALGSYVHFLYPEIPVLVTALGCYVIFTGLNVLGVKESALFSVVVTTLAVLELVVYLGIVAPAFKTENFLLNPLPFGWWGVFAALPFAIWLYVCIEGVAMVAEEVKDSKKAIAQGYISGILTLLVLALAVMIVTGGITNWQNLAAIDYPLPAAIGLVLGKNNPVTQLFAGIGLFGLIASFHGIILTYSRQLFALARSRYLPVALSRIHPRFKTPHVALLAGAGFGMLALFFLDTSKLVILSTFGAVVMYLVSMVSLFILRKKEPHLSRPFKAPFYPYFPAVAFLLAVVAALAFLYYYIWLCCLFLAGLLFTLIIFFLTGSHKKLSSHDVTIKSISAAGLPLINPTSNHSE
ncbi:ethanolamine permease [Adhaeribacter radiodurans]|uniref:Ethanolamine permease n=1 Tax=Adhaeribacter radiodurans TaxID=2745197 RepID=A0A7L7L6W6_9BACT|nr:ethanolamine permease [Adhaeribacter radiodurans]QMU28089.1 ethanolamine permease [Adhaeribacter radiodurans]